MKVEVGFNAMLWARSHGGEAGTLGSIPATRPAALHIINVFIIIIIIIIVITRSIITIPLLAKM